MVYKLNIDGDVTKFIQTLPLKHQRQIRTKVFSLLENPSPPDACDLKGRAPLKRCKGGEYRIIYKVEEPIKTITVLLIGNRNDDDVYRQMRRMFH